VDSSTIPPSNAKNVKVAGQRHPKTGIVFDQRGFPIFDDVAQFESQLPRSISSVKDRATHMREATRQVRDAIESGQIPRSRFSQAQLEAIDAGEATIPGFTWHHHQDVGRMQLVPRAIHRQTGHVGGFDLWY
jgi:hypothetical protein